MDVIFYNGYFFFFIVIVVWVCFLIYSFRVNLGLLFFVVVIIFMVIMVLFFIVVVLFIMKMYGEKFVDMIM